MEERERKTGRGETKVKVERERKEGNGEDRGKGCEAGAC